MDGLSVGHLLVRLPARLASFVSFGPAKAQLGCLYQIILAQNDALHDMTRKGMRVPLTGEALYISPQDEKSYFKGTIETLAYEFAP